MNATLQAASGNDLQHAELPVEGMTCDTCVAELEKALQRDDQVESVAVKLHPGRIFLRGAIPEDRLQELVKSAGFASHCH